MNLVNAFEMCACGHPASMHELGLRQCLEDGCGCNGFVSRPSAPSVLCKCGHAEAAHWHKAGEGSSCRPTSCPCPCFVPALATAVTTVIRFEKIDTCPCGHPAGAHGETYGCQEPSCTCSVAWPRVTPTATAPKSTDTAAPDLVATMDVLIARRFDELRELVREKNRACAGAGARPEGVFSKLPPIEQVKIRLDDKLKRIKAGNALPDTRADIIGYLVLWDVLEAMESNR